MIWQLDNSQIYIIGSVHNMKEGDNNHQDTINDVYDKVSKVVFETSLEPPTCLDEHNKLSKYLDENDKLSRNISKSLFRDTRKVWLKHDLIYSELEKSKIWLAAISIVNSIYRKNGFSNENGIDKIIWNKSKKDNKKIEWLESQQAGTYCWDNSPTEEQLKYLIKAVRDKSKIINELKKDIESWNAADEESLLRILDASIEEQPQLYSSLVFERNSEWLSKFVTAINSNIPTLFVVGVHHCVGKWSIQNMLSESHGFTSKMINCE
ncbi:MAG: TraB/GumN family protein [Colwellia sp.]|nr:TraB/GumN family protein [Colwellia sp.]